MSSDALPDDPATLKAMLLAERVQNERLRQIIKELQRHRFGRRAETLPEDQMLLCSATIWMGTRIASPEMFLNAGPLPHVICSPVGWDGGGDNEATEHGYSKGADGRCGPTLQRIEPRGEGANSR